MDDLIRRQAAIDALLGITAMRNTIPLDSAIFNIKKLPSAQSDLSDYSDKLWRNAYERGKEEAEVQKMQDLEQAEIQKAYELGKLDAMEEMPHWIPCSERLPERGGRYLISALDGINRRTTVAPYLPRCKAWAMTGRMAYWRVIAWMPLPEPYEEDKE